MKNVTCENFEKVYFDIRNELNKSTFVSIDCEFSGLFSDNESLFDTPSQRYQKIRDNVSQYFILQFGLSIHRINADYQRFDTKTYNFYLMPQNFPGVQENVMFQTSAVKFLSKNGNDWQTTLTKGLGYLSRDDERKLTEQMDKGLFATAVKNVLWISDFDLCDNICNKVDEWARTSNQEEKLESILPHDAIFHYYICTEIQKRFDGLWASCNSSNILTVYKVDVDQKAKLACDEKKAEIIMAHFRGFSKVFWDLVDLKCTIVGHNCLKDLVMMYQQFVGPLPSTYNKFKQEIHNLFPTVYDTKQMGYHLRQVFGRSVEFNLQSLEDLYGYFESGPGSKMGMFMPMFSSKCEGNFHSAGYDAYCTGVCFVRISYFINVTQKDGKIVLPRKCIPWPTMRATFEPLKNRINIIRGQVNFLYLGGPDPPCKAPKPLHIESVEPLDLVALRKQISCLGAYDIQSESPHRALVAVSNKRTADEIMEALRNHNYKVTSHVPFKYLLSGCAVRSAFVVVLVMGLVTAVVYNRMEFW